MQPSISKLLLATRELASREMVSKRIADVRLIQPMYASPSMPDARGQTELLLSTYTALSLIHTLISLAATWATCPINGYFPSAAKEHIETIDPRAALSLARVNWLHSKYNIVRSVTVLVFASFVRLLTMG